MVKRAKAEAARPLKSSKLWNLSNRIWWKCQCYCSLCFLYHTELKSLCTCTHTIHTCTQAAQHTQVPVLESWVHTAPGAELLVRHLFSTAGAWLPTAMLQFCTITDVT